MQQLQSTDSACRQRRREAESLRARETLAMAAAADGRVRCPGWTPSRRRPAPALEAVRPELEQRRTAAKPGERSQAENRKALNDAQEEAQRWRTSFRDTA